MVILPKITVGFHHFETLQPKPSSKKSRQFFLFIASYLQLPDTFSSPISFLTLPFHRRTGRPYFFRPSEVGPNNTLFGEASSACSSLKSPPTSQRIHSGLLKVFPVRSLFYRIMRGMRY